MKRGTPDHPKVYELCDQLGCDRPTALGYLVLLWEFAARYAPRGDIGRYSDKRIEAALDWGGRGKPEGKLIKSLTNCGWCDESPEFRLIIHDWSDHADQSVRKKLSRHRLDIVRTHSSRSPTAATTTTTTNGKTSEFFPKSSQYIKGRFPTTDDVMVHRIAETAIQAVLSAGEQAELVTDDVLLLALEDCTRTSPKQHSAGLYLTTVAVWMRNKVMTEEDE